MGANPDNVQHTDVDAQGIDDARADVQERWVRGARGTRGGVRGERGCGRQAHKGAGGENGGADAHQRLSGICWNCCWAAV
jgi:hypothetical protein